MTIYSTFRYSVRNKKEKVRHRFADLALISEECIITNCDATINPQQAFWLQFHVHGNGTEWIDQGLPIPSYHEHTNVGYIIAYALNGYFGTQKGTEYLNDIIARFLLSMREQKPTRIHSKPSVDAKGTYYPRIYKLKELQGLKSLSNSRLPRATADKFDDFTFWAIKFYCEDLIKSQGIPTASQLIEFALGNFEGKETSTLKAKCRSVWNYYEQRNWTIPVPYKRKCTEEQYMATRQENIRKVHENTAIKNQNKIKAVLDDIFLQDDIKFKNGKYRVGKIAELTKQNRKTVAKYLKEMNLIEIK